MNMCKWKLHGSEWMSQKWGGGRRVGMYFKEYTRKIVGIDPLLNKEVLHQLTK